MTDEQVADIIQERDALLEHLSGFYRTWQSACDERNRANEHVAAEQQKRAVIECELDATRRTVDALAEALREARKELWNIQERVDRGARENALHCIGLQRVTIDAALALVDVPAAPPAEMESFARSHPCTCLITPGTSAYGGQNIDSTGCRKHGTPIGPPLVCEAIPTKWRTGIRDPRDVYENEGLMFHCATPEEAARIVNLLNAAAVGPVSKESLPTAEQVATEETPNRHQLVRDLLELPFHTQIGIMKQLGIAFEAPAEINNFDRLVEMFKIAKAQALLPAMAQLVAAAKGMAGVPTTPGTEPK